MRQAIGRAAAAVLICAAVEAQQAPKPGPEHELLRKQIGTWDATVEMMPIGAPPSSSKGIERNRMVGGLWLVTDFESWMAGQPFHGHGTTGYDPGKRKYVSTWVDTFGTSLYRGESSYDPATRTLTGVMEGPDDSGQPMRMSVMTEYKDDDTRVVTMSMPGPDGKEVPSMKATYRKRTAAGHK
ncbi:MAG TPA: DUF1579 domain-containing protein [Vicinamibacteria bacterium]|nr:DUF1579 domain-containing protein [Vicinamibacteria bacterium]